MEIGYFTPPAFSKRPLDIDAFGKILGKHLIYASKGRWCLYHILKSLHIKGPVLLPVYCCSTVLDPLDSLGITYGFYDIQPETLNADLESVREQISLLRPDCIIAVSMYGNPCCLSELEQICKDNNIALIDDAAQSIGAKLNGKYVGTFGDAGFFAFSPGKPFSGHTGGFLWTKEPYEIHYKHHALFHRLTYWNYKVNRIGWVRNKNKQLPRVLKKLTDFLTRSIDIKYDGMEPFESSIMGGIMYDSWNYHTPMRTQLATQLKGEMVQTGLFQILIPLSNGGAQGIAHKYVLVCKSSLVADNLLCFLKEKNVAAQKGYRMLSDDLTLLPGAREVDGCVIEIPLDPNLNAYQYIKTIINEFIKRNDTNC